MKLGLYSITCIEFADRNAQLAAEYMRALVAASSHLAAQP